MMMSANLSPDTAMAILRRPQVESMTGLSRSSIYRMMNAGTFPKPLRLGAQAVGWIEGEIRDWIAALSPNHI
ncbi:AlpA family transcriptional regulator [Novosphingobium sp.]|uniref:AlpA family transcriptional regulator n=1 Tax=Novosphingobium sp. TaxID=1874826 RepID=UPI0031D33E72